MSNIQTKMIRIASKGFVTTSRGRVVAPISRPYREDVGMIFKMLSQRPEPEIYERLGNGREIRLTMQNYNKDNELIKPEITKPVTGSVNTAEMNEDKKQNKAMFTSNNHGRQAVGDSEQKFGKNYQNGKKNKNKGNDKQQPMNGNKEPAKETVLGEKGTSVQPETPLTDDTDQV